MVKKAYYAAFVPDDGMVSAFFPDFPGLFTWDETLELAFADATAGFKAHMEFMADDGDEIPEPSSLEGAKPWRQYTTALSAYPFVIAKEKPLALAFSIC